MKKALIECVVAHLRRERFAILGSLGLLALLWLADLVHALVR